MTNLIEILLRVRDGLQGWVRFDPHETLTHYTASSLKMQFPYKDKIYAIVIYEVTEDANSPDAPKEEE